MVVTSFSRKAWVLSKCCYINIINFGELLVLNENQSNQTRQKLSGLKFAEENILKFSVPGTI